VTASLLGMIAAGIIVTIAAVSIRFARRRLGYETWHALHLLLYAAVGIGLVHQFLEATTFPNSALANAYWWTLWALVITALIVGRVVLPVWRNAYHRFRVAAVVPESENVVSIHVTGRHLEKLPARAGQFFIWRFLGHNHWWQANPFSLSAAPDGRSLRLTAKAAGRTSARLRQVPVGTRVFAEGPYGAFTTLGSVVVLYRAQTPADAVLLEELQDQARVRGGQVHLLTGRTGAGDPPNRPFAPENLLGLVPDLADREVYVCGPPAMTSAVLRSLRELGVPRGQVHAERFSLA
jgi:predicted ferric reductase